MGGHPRASPASHSTTSTRLKRQRVDDSFTDTEDQQSPIGDEKHKKKVRWDGASRDTEEGEEAASSEETDREGKVSALDAFTPNLTRLLPNQDMLDRLMLQVSVGIRAHDG